MNSDGIRGPHSRPPARPLTSRQGLFVGEYVVDLNATRAAIAAGYSEKGARVRGAELLANRNISDEIAQRSGKRLSKLEITADRVLQQLARIAFFDVRKLFNVDGSAKQIRELDADAASVITSLEVRELSSGSGDNKHVCGVSRKYKLADKRGALELLGKHLNLFNPASKPTGLADNGELPPVLVIHFVDPPNSEEPQTTINGGQLPQVEPNS